MEVFPSVSTHQKLIRNTRTHIAGSFDVGTLNSPSNNAGLLRRNNGHTRPLPYPDPYTDPNAR